LRFIVEFFEKDKHVKFIFELQNGQPLQLTYYLQPNSLREKWLNEVKTYLNRSNASLNLKISNKNYLHLNELTEKINSIVKDINTAYNSNMLSFLSGTSDANREKLNSLHEKFEEYGADKKLYLGEDVHRLWLDLNEWIHVTEVAMGTTVKDFPEYSALVSVYPPYDGRRLEEKDKLFLTTDFSWGHLYLGYNTLGKDYMHACHDDDVRVVTNKQVKVQQRYSSEVWLCFQNKTYCQKTTELQFYKWYETIEQEAQEIIPIENLNALALGRYFLGHIVIDDDLLRFHPIEDDWYFNTEVQKRWNNEVFSQIKRVVEIEIDEQNN
jgi:hypothetical protein